MPNSDNKHDFTAASILEQLGQMQSAIASLALSEQEALAEERSEKAASGHLDSVSGSSLKKTRAPAAADTSEESADPETECDISPEDTDLRQLKEVYASDGKPLPYPFTVSCAFDGEKGNGLIFAAIFRNLYVFAISRNAWLRFNGNIWEQVDDYHANAAVEKVADAYKWAKFRAKSDLSLAMGDDNKEEIARNKTIMSQFSKNINRLHTVAGVNSCLLFALANDNPLLVKPDLLDRQPDLLGCENGIIHMRTGELSAGAPSDYITRACAAEWKGIDAPCPKWESMIYEILGENSDVTHYFHKAIGMSMFGKVTEKVFFIMLGEDGDSGKTTIFEILYSIVKDYASPMPVEMLLDRKMPKDPDNPTPSLMSLRGRRLCWASEPGENRRFSVEQIKLMSGNDSLTGRYAYEKDNTTFQPTHTLFVLTNHKMRASAHDQPFWSRASLIDCPFSFVPHPDPDNPYQRKRKENLKDEIISEESAGVLAWIVRGYQLYLAEGLARPPEIQKATDRYRKEENFIQEFIETCLEKCDGERTKAGDMYQCFKGWWLDNYGKNPPSNTTFGKIIVKDIARDKVGGIKYYLDYVITNEAEKYVK